MNISTKFTIKIPKNITVLYCTKKNIITFLNSTNKKSLKLKVKLIFLKTANLLTITNIPIEGKSIKSVKALKSLQGTAVAQIKQILLEMNYILYNKLNFVGVGYRAFPIESVKNNLYFKLGYSHLIYFKTPPSLKIHCSKFTKLFIFGNASYNLLTNTSASIRSYKKPEPYKGKGILYEGEKIVLKKGKKI